MAAPRWLSDPDVTLSVDDKRIVFDFCVDLGIKCQVPRNICNEMKEYAVFFNKRDRLYVKTVLAKSRGWKNDGSDLRIDLACFDSARPKWHANSDLRLSFFEKNIVWDFCERLNLCCECLALGRREDRYCKLCYNILYQNRVLCQNRRVWDFERISIRNVLRWFASARKTPRLF